MSHRSTITIEKLKLIGLVASIRLTTLMVLVKISSPAFSFGRVENDNLAPFYWDYI
jgi:hypothetical protein